MLRAAQRGCFLLVLLCLSYLALPISANVVYVDSSSSNLSLECGETMEQACATLSLGILVACRLPDTNSTPVVEVLPGEYIIQEQISLNCSLELR